MHKLLEFIDNELEELERKAEKDGKMSMTEVQYADTLAHMKKNLLTADAMEEEDYSNYGPHDTRDGYGGSYARGGYTRVRGYDRRNPRSSNMMTRSNRYDGYSRDAGDMIDELHDLMDKAPNEQTRMEIERLVTKLEKM